MICPQFVASFFDVFVVSRTTFFDAAKNEYSIGNYLVFFYAVVSLLRLNFDDIELYC